MRTLLLSLLRLGVPAGAILAALALGHGPATAQGGRSTLLVAVRAAATAEPIKGAQIILEGTGIGGVTNAAGMLRLEGLPPGVRSVAVRYLGYAPAGQTVQLTGGRSTTISFELELQSIPLAEVRVRAPVGVRRLAALGFYDRKEHGPGAFVTRSEIEARNPHRLSDILRTIPGLRLSPTPFSDARASMIRSSVPGRRCPIQYFLDGVQAFGFNIDDVPPRDIEGIEIYRGSSEVPPGFNRGTALCGAIVIWTRID